MDIQTIIGKLIANVTLTPNERKYLLDFFASLQSQKISRLSQITHNAGDLVAGRFIAPSPTSKSAEPTDATFTGSFMSGEGETFGSTVYNTGGVSLGVLQWGASQTNGKLYFGGGTGFLDQYGINLKNQLGTLYFESASGNQYAMSIGASTANLMQFTNDVGGMQFIIPLTNATTPYLYWREDPANANVAKLEINAGQTATRVNIGGTNFPGITLWANKNGTETVFNDLSYDIDFRVEGDTDANLFKIDAGLDSIGIGGAAENGYKLKVYGDLNVTGAFLINGNDIASGWQLVTTTWTRTGNHTFTVPGNLTATYRKGTKVWYVDGGTDEYGVVASSVFGSVTTVTLITNTDYTMAAATITYTAISYIENPSGFPHWFNFDPAPAGFSAVPSTPKYKWATYGRTITLAYAEGNNGTSNATTFTATAPVAPIIDYSTPLGTTVDNAVVKTTPGRMVLSAGSTTITFRSDSASGAWTNAGGKRAIGIAIYEF